MFVFSMELQFPKESFSNEKLKNSKLLMNNVHDRGVTENIFSSYQIAHGNRYDNGNFLKIIKLQR